MSTAILLRLLSTANATILDFYHCATPNLPFRHLIFHRATPNLAVRLQFLSFETSVFTYVSYRVSVAHGLTVRRLDLATLPVDQLTILVESLASRNPS